MMKQSDWQAVRDALIADDRAKLGAPPTTEELLAYERGDLSESEAERVQQLLVAYPELAQAFANPFPSEDAAEIDEAMIERQWQAFNAKTTRPAGGARILQFWRACAVAAIVAAVAFGSLLWRSEMRWTRPRVLPEPSILTPDGQRGLPEQHYAITPTGDSVLLVVAIVGATDYETYRLELIGASQKRLWSSGLLPATGSNSFDVEVPSRLLRPGTYQFVAYGLRGNARERVATYTIDVRRPSPKQ